MTTPPPAGWYPAPEDSSVWRYWDGNKWTDQWAPRTTAGPRKRSRSALWITLGTLAAVFIPFLAVVALVVALSSPSTTTTAPGSASASPDASAPDSGASSGKSEPPAETKPETQPDLDVDARWPPGPEWEWDGGIVAYRFLDYESAVCPEDSGYLLWSTEYKWCWTIDAVSQVDCPSGIRVEGYFLDIYGRGLDGIDVTTGELAAGQIATVPLGSTYETANEIVITSATCPSGVAAKSGQPTLSDGDIEGLLSRVVPDWLAAPRGTDAQSVAKSIWSAESADFDSAVSGDAMWILIYGDQQDAASGSEQNFLEGFLADLEFQTPDQDWARLRCSNVVAFVPAAAAALVEAEVPAGVTCQSF